MHPRVELAAAVALLLGFGVVAGALGRRHDRSPPPDPRRSSYLTGPHGARGLTDALERLEITVQRFRRRPTELRAGPASPGRELLALLSPTRALGAPTAQHLLEYHRNGGNLLLAGPTASAAMRCFGYSADRRMRDTVEVFARDDAGSSTVAVARLRDLVLVRTSDTQASDSSTRVDMGVQACEVQTAIETDTLLMTRGGGVAAVRLLTVFRREVILVADGALFSNRVLRDSGAGPFVLSLLAGRFDRVVVDEYHHGFGVSGNLFAATVRWSLHSPWGWAVWQLCAVGLLALLAQGVRFGSPRSAIARRRRSPLEHVRALATALAAAKGHDVAVDLIIKGLRRRLSPTGQPARGDIRGWLDTLSTGLQNRKSSEAARSLQYLIRTPQSGEGVLRAANAVEDVWEDLRP